MAACREILLTSEASGQLWNTCVWDPDSGTSQMTYKGSSSGPRTLCLLGHDYLLSAVNNKPLLHVWSLQRKDQMQMRIVCPGQVTALTISPDNLYCVGAVGDKIHIWQVATGNLLAVVSRHYQMVNCIKFTDDGGHFVSGGEDNLVIVWSMARILSYSQSQTGSTGVEPRHIWSSHSLPVTDVHVGYGGTGSRVLTASLDQTCKLWELSSGRLLCNFVFDTSIMSVIMDNAEARLYAGAVNGNIYQVNMFEKPARIERHVTDNEEESLIFKGHSKQVTCLSLSMDGAMLASGSHDYQAKLWDVASRQCIRTLPHKGNLTNVLLVPTPPNLLNVEGAGGQASLPIAQFKRHLHQPHLSDIGDGDHDRRDTVDVRIKKRKVEENESRYKSALLETCIKQLRTENPNIKTSAEVEAELRENITDLKKINRDIYQFAIKEIVKDKKNKL